MRRALSSVLGLSALVTIALTVTAHGALPPSYGGTLRIPAPHPLLPLDPRRARSGFEAWLNAAVFDTLYAMDADGHAVPRLAAEMPEIEGARVRIRILEGATRQDGQPLTASDVTRSLELASIDRGSAVWLYAFTSRSGRLETTVVDERTIELTLAVTAADAAASLAAAPLAIAAGRSRVGTGAFASRTSSDGGLGLSAFRKSPTGSPYLDSLVVSPPVDREEELRAFALGHLDASWHGSTLYGRMPAKRATVTSGPQGRAVMLVPNPQGVLASASDVASFEAAIDRRRLERVGLTPSNRLDVGLPPPKLGRSARTSGRIVLRLPVTSRDAFEERLGESLAGIVDEAGYSVVLDRKPPGSENTNANDAARPWDVRIVTVVPALPSPVAYVASALVAAGRSTEATQLLTRARLDDMDAARAAAERVPAIVLGHRRESMHHRADLEGLAFDALGRLSLGSLHFARRADGAHP